ncbi:alpha/beta hydrolase family protein [Pollutimonas sp. M17]|uniref:alpha/beta hydrolase family protein n=1 Tax=Pollutimonas sp. M17 TaxID=2962065 RepID=UPI0021F44024|nr:alpha/beta fold hydrolase [Pollutimonas sp. M17]UYO92463.1 prolyl oligopeptidase family serine peptidase [Pollutimonas sp. M17]
MSETLKRGRTRVRGFNDPEMDFQLMRQLGVSRYGGSSVGECLALAQSIPDADPDAWVSAFAQAGERQSVDASARLARGHRVSASQQYLLASNSYRAAEYYCGMADPKHGQYGLLSRQAFLAAMQCAGRDCAEVWIELDGQKLPAYHIRNPQRSTGRTLMIISGFDGTLEETYMAHGLAALERGRDLFLFTGPGQMDTLRFNPGSHFVPDFERAGRAAVDHLLAQPDTAPDALALMGISFGGYFALRIAAADSRIKALILNSPISDLHAYMSSFVGFDPAQMPDPDDFGPGDIDMLPPEAMNAQTREMARNLMLRFGQASFKQTYVAMREFRVPDEALARIACPVLALAGEGEGAEPLRQWRHVREHVSGPVGYYCFTAQEGADGHCQTGNLAFSAAVSMDWLDETLP